MTALEVAEREVVDELRVDVDERRVVDDERRVEVVDLWVVDERLVLVGVVEVRAELVEEREDDVVELRDVDEL